MTRTSDRAPADRTLAAMAMACGVLILALGAGALWFAALERDWSRFYAAVAMSSFPIIAAIILRTHRRNPVAWCFLIGSTLLTLNELGDAGLAAGTPRQWPTALLYAFAWSTGTAWFPGLFLMITVGLLQFPDGRLPGRFWRWLTWAACAVPAVYAACFSLGIWSVPLGLLTSDAVPHAPGVAGLAILVAVACIPAEVPIVVGVAASLVVRWRRSEGVERLQIRWVVAAGTLALLVEVLIDLAGSYLRLGATLQTVVETSALTLVAVATGIAVTRYGLYEIDRIVSRTVSYLVLSTVLVGVYAVVVTAAALVIPDRYGSLGVATGTLAAVALFVPLRARVQRAVDRRFDRSRYDGEVLVDEFAAALRADRSLDDVHEELLRAVRRTVAPASASIWIAR